MKKPQYLSPTSIGTWAKDPTEFYLRYLSDSPPPKEKQTLPMSVGSSFDAYVKSYLHEQLFGKGADPKFELKTLFEKQVDPQNREWAWTAGEHVFNCYRQLGSLDHLMTILGKTAGKPRFEMDVRGEIHGRHATLGAVPFNGHPDLFFVTEHDAHVILDWKVNGYCSSSAVSPMQGYVRLRETGKIPSGHAKAKVQVHKGLYVNVNGGLETFNEDWARQCAIYSWLCGEEVGAEFVTIIHQIVCKPNPKAGGKPILRSVEHHAFVRPDFQKKVFAEAAELWETINSDWIFRSMSKEQSQEHCKTLDARAATLAEDDWYSRAARK